MSCGQFRMTTQTKYIQMPSKVSEFDRNQKAVALLLTEMLKVKCKHVNKSKFGSFGSAILLHCSVPSTSVRICSVLNRSNQDTTKHYGLILCAYGEMATVQQWNNNVIYLYH